MTTTQFVTSDASSLSAGLIDLRDAAWSASDSSSFVARDYDFVRRPRDVSDDVSSISLEYQDRKAALLTIVDQMVFDAPSWDADPAVVTADASETAIRFLKSLPSNRELPKVAPDGEGNILFIWEPPRGNCLLTVEKDLLHAVDQPGTPYVTHIDAKEFRGSRIPVSILHLIPAK